MVPLWSGVLQSWRQKHWKTIIPTQYSVISTIQHVITSTKVVIFTMVFADVASLKTAVKTLSSTKLYWAALYTPNHVSHMDSENTHRDKICCCPISCINHIFLLLYMYLKWIMWFDNMSKYANRQNDFTKEWATYTTKSRDLIKRHGNNAAKKWKEYIKFSSKL